MILKEWTMLNCTRLQKSIDLTADELGEVFVAVGYGTGWTLMFWWLVYMYL